MQVRGVMSSSSAAAAVALHSSSQQFTGGTRKRSNNSTRNNSNVNGVETLGGKRSAAAETVKKEGRASRERENDKETNANGAVHHCIMDKDRRRNRPKEKEKEDEEEKEEEDQDQDQRLKKNLHHQNQYQNYNLMMHNRARLRSRSPVRSTPSLAVAVSRKFSRLDWICWAARVSVKWSVLFIFLFGLGWAVNAGFSRVWSTFYPEHRRHHHHPGNMNRDIDALESQIAELQNMLQVQLELLNIKFNKEVDSVKKEFEASMKDHASELYTELKSLKDSTTEIEEVLKKIKESEMLTRHDVQTIVNEVFEDRDARGDGSALSLDDVRVVARRLIESEIERHASDGLGMVDFAVGSSGSKVVRHSEPYFAKMSGWGMAAWVVKIGGLHPHASKVLEPSFGEPGQCLPLNGSKGFVDIALRSSILVSAVTLEHVAKSVAFDRSSAPKDFQILGWNDEEESPQISVLGEFRYDLENSNVQTFNFPSERTGKLVNMIKLDVLSNHGSVSHTCIYRLRVHGSDPRLKPSITQS